MSDNANPRPSCIPPKKFERNEHGLICDGSVEYVYNEDGTINWRKMIKAEFLTPNKQYFQRFQKKIPESTEGLEDRELLILLGGIKDLAQIRGLSEVSYDVHSPTKEYVVATCKISWIPNYETENRVVTFSAIGDAHPGNTNNFGKIFLGPIAENRAFVRCVRNFLRVNIVSQEELSPVNGDVEGDDMALNLLRDTMAQYGVTFELVKKKLVEEKVLGAENFTCIEDVPNVKKFELIERIKQKAAASLKKA